VTDRVTPDVALFVFNRDRACQAPYMGASYHDCFSPDGLEHVKAEPRMSRRAPSCPCALVVLCAGHREPGMRQGAVWCTARENRAALRDYLTSFGYGDHHDGHAAEIMARVAA